MQLWLDVEWLLYLRRQCAPKGEPSIGRGRRLGVGDSKASRPLPPAQSARKPRITKSPPQTLPMSAVTRPYPWSIPVPARVASAIRALAGRGINPSPNKIISEEVYVKVAGGRRTRWPIDGESCDSDSIVMWNAQSCELRHPGCG